MGASSSNDGRRVATRRMDIAACTLPRAFTVTTKAVWSALSVPVLLVVYVFGLAMATEPGILQEVCQMDSFVANCPENTVIVMASALYGRMRLGDCVQVDMGHLGCHADVRRYFDGQCSGRRSCEVRVPNDQLFDLSTCSREMSPYLEASYTCLPVLNSGFHQACLRDGVVMISEHTQGIIASSIVFGDSSSSRLCPWVIQSQPAQRINLTLVDFGSPETTGLPSDGYRPECQKYAIIRERSETSDTTVCSGNQRERNIYLSKTNRVEINFVDSRTSGSQANFLIKFSFVGCPDPPLNGNVLVERTTEKAVLRCDSTGQRWTLYCNGAQWNARTGNCTKKSDDDWSLWQMLSEDWSSPKGIVITVAIGVALGTVIGLALLFCVLLCMKKRRDMNRPAQSIYYEDRTLPKGPPADPAAAKWDGGIGLADPYNTCGRRPTKEGHYAHVWSPVNSDVMVMETTELPRRMANQSGRHNSDTIPSPSHIPGYLEHSEHVYEKPK